VALSELVGCTVIENAYLCHHCPTYWMNFKSGWSN
jgi:hypothetical protein